MGKRLEIDRFIVRGAILPTPIENPEPFKGQGPHSGLMSLPSVALLLVIDLCSEGVADGFSCPLHKGLSEERRTLQAPMDPGLLAAAFRDRRDAGIFLQFSSGRIAFTLFAEGDQQPGGEDRASAWECLKQWKVRMVLGMLGNGVVKVGNGLSRDAELRHEGLDQEGIGCHDAFISGQGGGSFDRLEPLGDHLGRAHVMVTEKGLKRRTAGELHGLQSGPATQEGAEDHGIFILKPAPHVREGVLEGAGQAVRHAHLIADEAAAGRDELCARAPLRALGLKRLQLVTMFQEALELECGVRGIVLGAAGSESLTVPRQGKGVEREQDEEVVLAQRGDKGSFVALKAHGDGMAAEALAQGTDPGVDRFRGMVEDTGLACGGASGLEAEIMCGIGPVDPNKGRKCVVWSMRHASSPGVGESAEKGHAR
jgi:hypothetical protein